MTQILPTANFTSNVTSGAFPLSVQFNDTSLNETLGRTWQFGDGGTSTIANPIHKYNSAGSYIVKLTANNGNGSDFTTKTINVTATEPVSLLANFTSNVTEGYVPLSVQFNDTSTGTPTSWQWNFGDGSNNSTEQNLPHTFTSAGVYHVTLTVMNNGNSSTKTKNITVNSPIGGSYAYISNNRDNTVSVIDTTTDTVVATIPVGLAPYGVVTNPTGTKVYITNQNSSTVSVVDRKSNIVTKNITVGKNPAGIAITPSGTKVYVTNFDDGTVSVINTTTDTVTDTIKNLYYPWGVAVTPNGAKAYVAEYGTRIIQQYAIIDTATDNVTPKSDYGSNVGIAFNPSGTKVYIASYSGFLNEHGFSIIGQNGLLPFKDIGEDTFGVAFTPDGAKAYLTSIATNNVSVINAIQDTVLTSVDVGSPS